MEFRPTLRAIRLVVVIGSLAMASSAHAQMPVIDNAVLTQASQTASNTSDIMRTNQQIMTYTQQTLAAVTGNRSTGSLATAALGGGFTMAAAPSLTSLLGGGGMSWGNLGAFGNAAATIINGLNLVRTLSGAATPTSGTDQAYVGAVNTAAAMTGIIQGAQSAATNRTSALQNSSAQIGTAPDIKGSIDQNSQMQIQTAQTINEVIGAVNATNASLNAQQMQDLAAAAKASEIMNGH